MDHTPDPWAIDGKFPSPEEHAQLLVIGAGPAGIAAALEAASLGLRVVLIDENPVPATLMGLDVPLFYGQRMTAAVQEPDRMIERLVANTPGLDAAFDAGVEVRLGITAWGLFTPGPAIAGLPAAVAGLSDATRSWMCGFDALILATGARDLILGFPGIDMPGVMGARAFHSLLARYDAFDGHRLLILGSGDLAMETAQLAQSRGLTVAALAEVLPYAQSDAAAALDIPLHTNTTILRAESDGLTLNAAILGTPDGTEQRIACDTIVLAIGTVPAIELAAAAGCRTTFRGQAGGHIPILTPEHATTRPAIFAAGDCAGLADPAACQTQARAAAHAAADHIAHKPPPHTPTAQPEPALDTTTYRLAWMRALLAATPPETPACLCEDVTRADLLGIRPPRYLNCVPRTVPARNSATLLQDGPLNPDQIKRLTRAGMGLCQGRRCREQIALMLALDSNTTPAAIPLATYRAPVRPLPLSVLADPQSMPGWDVWFGIRSQWIPYDAIGTPAEATLPTGNMHA
jgi:thioredoxin reductase